jgi:predicted NBD/HSP70 family sugar kinase
MLAGENRLMHCAIGLDLGGSSAKVALVAQTGDVLAEDRVASPSAPDPEAVLSPIAAAVDRLRLFAAERALPVVALGGGFSGYLDRTGTTIAVNNTPALDARTCESASNASCSGSIRSPAATSSHVRSSVVAKS